MPSPSPIPSSALQSLSARPRQCVQRLLAYGLKHGGPDAISWPDVDYPRSKMAAVLVLLFEGASGELEVLLTTRSLSMRTHAGQTALPGGKAEEDEETPVLTAFREAHEEVGLPPSTLGSIVYVLCGLPPFPSLHKLLVVPVVALLTDNNLLAGLERSVSEVDALFYHQLEAVLDPGLANQPGIELADKGSHNWPYDDEVYNTSDSEWLYGWQYRMHRFRTTHSPIKGLTADILLLTAQIAYERSPTFERFAPRQKPFEEMIDAIVNEYHAQPAHDAQEQPRDITHLIPT